jgi:hypothetical protein
MSATREPIGSSTNRENVIIALERAKKNAIQTDKVVGWGKILQGYKDLLETKTGSDSTAEIDFLLGDDDTRIVEVYTSIYRKDPKLPWSEHFHATMTMIIELTIDRDSPKEHSVRLAITFSHAVFFILVSVERYVPSDGPYRKVVCHIKIPPKVSLKKITRLAIGHWYTVNVLKGNTAWPTSCTGFTDFLLYCLYQKDLDILSLCPLTIQRKKKHTVYHKDGSQEIDAGIRVNVDHRAGVSLQEEDVIELDDDDDDDMGMTTRTRSRRW